MLHRTISLLLPVLFPSWRFFMTVGPSPRVEYREKGGVWRESHPKPAYVSVAQMAGRMFFNHERNTQLYAVALAERLIAAPGEHSREELQRLVAEAHGTAGDIQFRLVFVMREEAELVSEVLYTSALFAAGEYL